MSNEILKKFASELKTRRENSGLTIDELHAHTRIDKKFLEAIEDGNFSILPEVYVRAFIREYAMEIGLEPEETLRKFDLAKGGSDFNQEANIKNEKKEEVEEKKISSDKSFVDSSVERTQENKIVPKKNRNIYFYVLGVVVLFIVLYFLISPSNKEQIVVERKYTPAKVEKTQQKIEPKVTAKIKKAKPFKVELLGSDTVWIRAKIDNAKTEEFTLVPEVSRIISVNDTLKLVIGNAAGVKVNINDKPVKFTGRKGEVKNLILTRNGLAGK